MSRFFIMVLCLSMFVGGTASAKKEQEKKVVEPFISVEFNTIKSPNANHFGLVYDNAITKNEQGKVNIHRIYYQLGGLKIAANVYTPANYDATKNKELYLIPGATHIKTYYVPEYVELAVNKLTEFFGQRL